MSKEITVEPVSCGDQKRLKLMFVRDDQLAQQERNLKDCKWSSSMQCWHIPFYNNHLEYLNEKFRGRLLFRRPGNSSSEVVETKNKSFSPVAVKIPEKLTQQFKLKRFSTNTINAYSSIFLRYMEFCQMENVDYNNPESINIYLLFIIENWNISISYQNQAINSIKFYFRNVLGKELKPVHVQRPKKEKKLPEVFSEEEVVMRK